ncbi:MAG: phage DNA packaging protein J [Firmicutes bacterium]|nr:phage DNA packaging protein J [Bacillota bacterium]
MRRAPAASYAFQFAYSLPLRLLPYNRVNPPGIKGASRHTAGLKRKRGDKDETSGDGRLVVVVFGPAALPGPPTLGPGSRKLQLDQGDRGSSGLGAQSRPLVFGRPPTVLPAARLGAYPGRAPAALDLAGDSRAQRARGVADCHHPIRDPPDGARRDGLSQPGPTGIAAARPGHPQPLRGAGGQRAACPPAVAGAGDPKRPLGLGRQRLRRAGDRAGRGGAVRGGRLGTRGAGRGRAFAEHHPALWVDALRRAPLAVLGWLSGLAGTRPH